MTVPPSSSPAHIKPFTHSSIAAVVRGGQINMQKSHSCATMLMQHVGTDLQTCLPSNRPVLKRSKSFLYCLQEPPVHGRRVVSLGRGQKLLYNGESGVPRAAIYASRDLQIWPMQEFSSRDICTCLWKTGETKLPQIVVTSVYMDITFDSVWPKELDSLMLYCRRKKLDIIICADTNAHSGFWGCADNNKRGDDVEEFVLTNNLSILNEGFVPTFRNKRAATIIDVTMASMTLEVVKNWRVFKDNLCSDHHLIEFDLTISTTVLTKSRNWNLGDFNLFQSDLEKRTPHLPQVWNYDALDEAATSLTKDINASLDISHPKRIPRIGSRLPRWWNSEAKQLKLKVSLAASQFRKQRTEESYDLLTQARRAFSKLIRKLKRRDWKDFCAETKNPQKASLLDKVIKRQENKVLGLLRRDDDSFCRSPEESMGHLLDTHFPGSRPTPAETLVENGRTCDIDDESASFITVDKVKQAIHSFGSHKAAGPDEIKPIALKWLGPKAINRLSLIFRASCLLSYVPKIWRNSKVVFIPKPGKKDYTNARAFRPISLSSFQLKVLERIWLWELESTSLKECPLSENQHAFRKGHSTETALSNMVEYLESALIPNKFALAVFLDIQGAFDNISSMSVTRGMQDKHFPNMFIQWYDFLLRNRKINIRYEGVHLERFLTKGTPQGGVLSPLAWNLAFESFLKLFEKGPVKACGFADDAGLVTTGDSPLLLKIRMQEALDETLNWGRRHGLQFSAPKTVVLLVTHRRKYFLPPPLQMDGVSIPYSTTARYLGVTLDSKLSWRPHCMDKIRKAKMHLARLKSAMGKLWGCPPKQTRWLYTGIVRPAITYGCIVWMRVCSQQWFLKEAGRLNRLALLSLGNFRRGTPTAGLEIIAYLPPLDLVIKKEAVMAYFRTESQTKLSRSLLYTKIPTKRGHRQLCLELLSDVGITNNETDDIPEIFIWERHFKVNDKSLQQGRPSLRPGDIDIYTDGSKHSTGAGAGIAVYREGEEILTESIHLGTKVSVFQAEIFALSTAANLISQHWPTYRVITLYCDSQAAIRAVRQNSIHSNLVADCIVRLNRASTMNAVQIRWIKAHANHLGNEKADELAKEGAMNPSYMVDHQILESKKVNGKEISLLFDQIWSRRWSGRLDCRQTKLWFDAADKGASFQILQLGRERFSEIVQLITGHNFMLRHRAIIGEPVPSICRLCEEDEESSFHVIAECPALAVLRHQILGEQFLKAPLHWSCKFATFLREGKIGLLNDPAGEE